MSELDKELEKAVDDFADEMKKKLLSKQRAGWDGWQAVGFRRFSGGKRLLAKTTSAVMDKEREHLVGVANLAMMIHRSTKPKD